MVKGHLGSTGHKFPYQNRSDFLDILTRRGGAVLPEHVDLEQLLAKKSKMGDGAPMVRVVVGKNYGQNTDGSPKPVRAIIEEWIYFPTVGNIFQIVQILVFSNPI